MPKTIEKRDGRVVRYIRDKAWNAIAKASDSIDVNDRISEKYITLILDRIDEKYPVQTSVEDIQDMIEEELMKLGFHKLAKKYIVYRNERSKKRNIKQNLLNYKKVMDDYLNIDDWRVKENASVSYSLGGLILSNSGAITANYWLTEAYTEDIAEAHRNADIHIHDLSMLAGYCAGWSLKQLIQEGLGGVPGKISSAPAQHLSTLCNQMVNFLGIMQNEWAGAQAFSSFDTYLAPFVKKDNLTYKQVKQAIQSFVYGVNTPSRWGCQAPFSNITLDWTCPPDMKDLPAIIGGELQDFTYGDCKKEMDMVNKAFIEIMIEGDANGRGHSYPIPTYSITNEFDWSETENNKLLFEMAAKYGIPYFSNYVNSDMEPSDVRSMCPLTGDTIVPIRLDGQDILRLYDIKTIYELNREVLVMTKSWDWATAKPVKMPMTKVYRISFSHGKYVDMGEHHLQPVLHPDKMDSIEAKFLKVGDFVPILNGIRLTGEPVSETEIENNSGYVQITDIQEIECNDEYLYCFEVDNEDHLFVLANGIVTHNCRLRLDLRELRKKSGGFFGSGESTGSIGVVSINMPKLGYLSNNVEDFYKRLNDIMDISAKSLKIKRDVVNKLLEDGLFPYTKRYLGSFNNHFSTIGLVGMNEMCLNASWLGKDLRHKDAQKFSEEVLNYMRNRLSDYQELYGDLYNLEATPAESTSYRFAKHDLEKYPDIINASCYHKEKDSKPYYTNSSHLPVGTTDDVFEALDVQDHLQVLYTSGTVFHTFLGEKLPDWRAAATLVRKIAENYKLPYYTLSPTYSVCADHGYIVGEHYTCPTCGKVTEVYSRITGYYRAIQNWNDGKAQEFKDRKEYEVIPNIPVGVISGLTITKGSDQSWTDTTSDIDLREQGLSPKDLTPTEKVLTLVSTSTCSNCKIIKKMMDDKGIMYNIIDAIENTTIAKRYGLMGVPALIISFPDDTVNDVVLKQPAKIIKYIEAL